MINDINIKDNNPSLLKYALHYGALLGLFWMFKYLFEIGAGFSIHVFKYIFYVLNVGTFLLIYIFTFKYKFSEPDKPKKVLHCILFVVLICFFASFFEGAIMYAHFKFINPDYFLNLVNAGLDMMKSMPALPSTDQVLVEKILSSKLVYIISNFMGNSILGLILGSLMGLLINTGNKKS